MADPFAAMFAALLDSPLCADATLRGQPVRVFVERNVEMIGDYAQVVGHVVAADIPASANPAADNALVLTATGEQFILDRLISNDGHIARWVLRSA